MPIDQAAGDLTSFSSSSERATSTRFACSLAYASAIAAPCERIHFRGQKGVNTRLTGTLMCALDHPQDSQK